MEPRRLLVTVRAEHGLRQATVWLIMTLGRRNHQTMPKPRTVIIIAAYQVVPLLLIGAWIMPSFFDLFGVDQNDMSWRSYAACVGGWVIMEAPLIAWLVVKSKIRKKQQISA